MHEYMRAKLLLFWLDSCVARNNHVIISGVIIRTTIQLRLVKRMRDDCFGINSLCFLGMFVIIQAKLLYAKSTCDLPVLLITI